VRCSDLLALSIILRLPVGECYAMIHFLYFHLDLVLPCNVGLVFGFEC